MNLFRRLLGLSCLFALLLPIWLSCDDEPSTVNSLPTLADQQISTDEETSVVFELEPYDVEQAELQIDLVQLPQHGQLAEVNGPTGGSAAGHWLHYRPDSAFHGADLALLRLWDGLDSSAIVRIEFDVLPVNTEEAAVIIAENFALQAGGVLEDLEAIALLSMMPTEAPGSSRKAQHSAEAVFDPDSCIWSIDLHRENQHLDNGDTLAFSWDEEWRVWMRTVDGDCVHFPDSTLRWLDEERQFSGSSRNRRFQGSKSGQSAITVREFNAGEPGVVIQGEHARSGSGQLLRRDFWVDYQFELRILLADLRVVQLGQRVLPVSGQIAVVLDLLRNDVSIHRQGIVSFGEGGQGQIRFDDGAEWVFDSFTGDVNPLQ